MRNISPHSFKDNILLAVMYAIRILDTAKTSSGKHAMDCAGETFGFGLDLTKAWGPSVRFCRNWVDGLGRRFLCGKK